MKRFLWIFWVIPVFFNIQESFANIADANDEIVEEKAIDPLLKRYVKQARPSAMKQGLMLCVFLLFLRCLSYITSKPLTCGSIYRLA